jgi:hypothetical protein
MADEMDTIDDTVTKVHDNGALPVRKRRPNDQASLLRRRQEAQREYGRGPKIPVKSIKDKKLRANLKHLENKYQDATLKAKDAEILLEQEGGFLEPEHELERTWRITQEDIKKDVALETAKKGFELKLDTFGPYVCDYTRTGKDLLLAGRKGHVATMDWRDGKLGCELQLGETIRDAKWLHNNQMFAVAQKKYVYIYDSHGVEIHCLKKHIEVTNMEFLPYHYLLATVVRINSIPSPPLLFLLNHKTDNIGQCWVPQIPRHFHRANGDRAPHTHGLANLPLSKPLQRHPPHGPPKRHSHALVPQLHNPHRQTACAPRPRARPRHRPRRPVHGVLRPRQPHGGLGHPDVP